MPIASVSFDVPPHRFSGNVYGALLNHGDSLAALGSSVNDAPYKGAPRAVVLYVKPRNTLAGPGDAIMVPRDVDAFEVGASIGLVMGRTACNVLESEAMAHIAGYVIVADVGVPHSSFYRPHVRQKARDGSCPVGPSVVARTAIADPAALGVRVFVDGRLEQERATAGWIRSPARLVAEVSDFMTLVPGDVLMTGVAPGAPQVRAGQRVVIEVESLGRLEIRFVAEAGVAA